MRITISLMAAAAMMLAAGSASATIGVTVANLTVTGAGASAIGNYVSFIPGSTATVEFDIFFSKTDDSNVGAFGISIFGYDLGTVGTADDAISFVSGLAGSSSSSLFLEFNLSAELVPNPIGSPTGPNEFGGVSNLRLVPNELSIAGAAFQTNVMSVFNTDAAAGIGSGAIDGGVNGLVGGAQVHMVFQLTGFGSLDVFTMMVGLGNGDAATDVTGTPIEVVGDSIFFNVPEPGTALLMALGLASLSAAGRRTVSKSLTGSARSA